jgi:magnesium transporter
VIRVMQLNIEGGVRSGGEELLDGAGPFWIDAMAPTEEEMQRLARRYGLHPLAVEDCLRLDQRPKLEQYPGHFFLVLQGFTPGPQERSEPALQELHFFLGSEWLISVHGGPCMSVERIAERIVKDRQLLQGRGLDFILYLIADTQVDQSFPLLDTLSETLEDLEDDIFQGPRQEQLERMFMLKRRLVRMRRVLSPQRDVVGTLSRPGLAQVQERTTLYFRDVHDHLLRLYEQIDAARDILANAMEGYLQA